MKIIICGAGQVGWQLARYLSREDNDVTIVDREPRLIARAIETLDVGGVVGFASYPEVLRAAGAEDADMIIAATHSDEVNMVTCQISHSLFKIHRKIARLRSKSYLDAISSSLYNREHLPIDVVISPEQEVAEAALDLLSTSAGFDVADFLDDNATMIGIEVGPDCPIVNTSLRQLSDLFSTLQAYVAAFRRDGRLQIAAPDDQIFPSDQVYVFTRTSDVTRTFEIFGKTRTPTNRILIFGGGNIGTEIASSLERRSKRIRARIIEKDQSNAESAAEKLRKTVVMHGDALDTTLLSEANVEEADAVVAVTDDDKTNLLAAMRAKSLGAKTCLSLINDTSLTGLANLIGIDATINPRATTVSSILRHLRHGRIRSVYSIGEGEAEILEMEVLPKSKIVDKALEDINFSEDARIALIKQDDNIIRPTAKTKLRVGMIVVIFALSSAVSDVEDLFQLDVDFF